MIDAGLSLRAAEGLRGAQFLTYLVAKGWTARPSRVEGVSILSKEVAGADRPAEFILPITPGFDDEQRRVADGLRTVAQLEHRSESSVAEEVAQFAAEAGEPEAKWFKIGDGGPYLFLPRASMLPDAALEHLKRAMEATDQLKAQSARVQELQEALTKQAKEFEQFAKQFGPEKIVVKSPSQGDS